MNAKLEKQWYHSSLTYLTGCLLPLSWLFRVLVNVRRFLYRIKIKKSYRFSVPVIVVGNITVGGTGKTPFVIWLAELLRAHGYTPGIVSRGVGGKKHQTPFRVSVDSNAHDVGDEAVLLAKRTHCPVVICVNRVAAVTELLATENCDIIISDDGLQHYRLERDIEIVIIDGMRELGNQQLLPAGPLREPLSRLNSVNFIVRHGKAKSGEYAMNLIGNTLVSIQDPTKRIPLTQLESKRVHAVVAIGNPKRFYMGLREQGFDVIEHSFPDHYLFMSSDLNFPDTLPVIMTEKDAVKCHGLVDERCWYIPVETRLEKSFADKLIQNLRGNL